MVKPVFRIGKQSVVKVPASTFVKMPRGNTSINKDGEWEKRVALGGRGQSVSIPTTIVFNGSTEIAIGFNAVKYMAEAFCGEGGKQGNLLIPNLSYKPDYYTVDLADNEEQLRFMNCVIDTISLSTSPDNELTGTIGYISNRSEEVTFDESNDTVLYDGSDILYYQLTDINFAGIDLASLGKSFTFEASNNIDSTVFNVLKGREYPLIRYGDLSGSVSMDVLDFNNVLRPYLWGNEQQTGASESLVEDLVVTFTNKRTGETFLIKGKAKITELTSSTPVNEITTTSVVFTYEFDGETERLFYFEEVGVPGP